MAKNKSEENPAEKLAEIPPASGHAADAAKVVTAASIVAEDNDKFPEGTNSAPPPVPEAFASAPGTPTPSEPLKRGRGRPPGSKTKNKTGEPTFDDLPPPKPPAPPVNYKAIATMCFKMGTNGMANIFGPEWLPRPPPPGLPGEEEMVIEATARYMESKEMPDIPPGAMLCLVLMMYSAPRFQAPPTKEKIKGVWMWFKNKFGRKNKFHVTSEHPRQPEKKVEETSEEEKNNEKNEQEEKTKKRSDFYGE